MDKRRSTRIDRAKLTEEIIQLEQQISRAMMQDTPDTWMDLSLTVGQLKSLSFIDFHRSTNLRRLAAALGVTPPSATRIIDNMVKQGLVSREENPENRRMLLVRTTDKGKAVLAKLRQSGASSFSDILARLGPEELSTLAQGLAAVVRATEVQRGGSSCDIKEQ